MDSKARNETLSSSVSYVPTKMDKSVFCIILTDKSDKELLKFTYNAIALNLINEKIESLNNVTENEPNATIETTDTNENDPLNNQNDESLEKTTE